MKYLLILVATLTLVSCKKQNDGYMFKMFHHVKGSDWTDSNGYTHSRILTDYFAYPENNEAAALEYYNKKHPWNPKMLEIDSTWAKYYCTVEEWERK